MAYPQGPPGEDWGGDTPWTGQSQPPPTGPPQPPQQQPQYQQPQYQQSQYQSPQYGPGYQQYARPPQNYLIPAILVTLFCFLPTGIAAIVFATQVNAKAGAGDWAGAEVASNKAKMWTFISLGVGLFAGLLILLTNAAGGGY
ncbi:CD225/dispanin family protein [Streptomyces chrestomyceticus]|uniref:CD225/dispanin family protein n=1 Tax=Streptomyces chrestomyceticus TaxID=68185 RepID=UPI0037989559